MDENKTSKDKTAASTSKTAKSQADAKEKEPEVPPEEAGCCLDIFPLWCCTIQ